MEHILQGVAIRHWAQRTQIYLAIPMGMAGGWLLAEGLNIGFGKRLMAPGLFIPAFLIFVVGLVAILLVYFLTRGKLNIYRQGPGILQVDVDFPNGENYSATGKFICTTTYIKVYARYGMYTKYVAVCLYCDEQPFLLLRHQIGGLGSVPDGFVEVSQLTNPGVPEIWCKSALRIVELIRS